MVTVINYITTEVENIYCFCRLAETLLECGSREYRLSEKLKNHVDQKNYRTSWRKWGVQNI